MLGNGRPFVLEFVNPRRVSSLTPAVLAEHQVGCLLLGLHVVVHVCVHVCVCECVCECVCVCVGVCVVEKVGFSVLFTCRHYPARMLTPCHLLTPCVCDACGCRSG